VIVIGRHATFAPVPARDISVAERRARLGRRHRLAPSERTDDAVTIAADLVALHATDPVTPYLSVAARMAHPHPNPEPASRGNRDGGSGFG
jgi:hypothetical protein